MRKLQRTNYRLGSVLLYICLVASGCNNALEKPYAYPNTTTPTEELIASPTPTRVDTAHPTDTVSATTTIPNPTSSPTIAPVISPTSSPTIRTPQPTLPPEEARTLLLDLLENNAGCQLPCWWGIMPGEAMWSEARNFLETFAYAIKGGVISDTIEYYSAYFPVSEDIYPVTLVHNYTVHDGVVENIEVIPGYLPTYNLSTLLITYGVPSEVYVFTFSHAREGDLPFDVVLFYPSKGILALYSNQAQVVGEEVHGCPQQKPALVLSLWPPGREITFLEASNMTINIRVEDWTGAYYSLQEATGMDIETFYNTFKDPDNSLCLETPADIWDPPD